MYKKFRPVPSPLCTCGKADQTAEHVLQDSQYNAERRHLARTCESSREAVRQGGGSTEDGTIYPCL